MTHFYRRRTGNPMWGRVTVTAAFAAYAALGAAFVTEAWPRGGGRQMMVGVGLSGLWLVVLLGGIWRGREWARLTLVGLLALWLLGSLLTGLEIIGRKEPLPFLGSVASGLNVAVILVMCWLPGIRALTKRKHHLDPY